VTGTGSASVVVPAAADAVFATLTDIGRLPQWNVPASLAALARAAARIHRAEG
jgi:hypothetical protein